MLPFITQPAVASAYPIGNSLLFRGGQSLSRTPSVAGNRRKWTFSAWVRRSALIPNQVLFGAGTGTLNYSALYFSVTDLLRFEDYISGQNVTYVSTTAAFRDVTAFYHVVLAYDTTRSTGQNPVRMYVNGEEQEQLYLSSYLPPQDYQQGLINSAGAHYMSTDGLVGAGSSSQLYLAEPFFVDGQALSPSAFGKADPVTGSWQPKTPTGIDFGPNGFHLGKPWDFANLGKDYSGRGNTWTPYGFAATDVLADSPTNVYATLNPLSKGSLAKLSEGNLKRKTDSTTANNGYGQYTYATLPIPADGVWQMEVRIDTSAANGKGGIGVAIPAPADAHATTYLSYYPDLGKIVDEKGDLHSGATATLGDLIQVVVDTMAGTVTWYKNGALLYSHSRDVAGWFFNVRPYASNVPEEHSVNFGQRAFVFLPEVNARPLCTANLPLSASLPTGTLDGSFTGNASADGPCVYTGVVPQALIINGTHEVTWGVHADKLATGFKLRTASASYNGTGSNTWTATYDRKPTVGPKGRAPANAQANP